MLVTSVAPWTLHAQTFKDIHDFNCSTDGCEPGFPGIVAQGRDGNLYSILQFGGSGQGTVYRITPSGTLNAIYNFLPVHGPGPQSGLTLGTDGNFYGATLADGANGYGTLFQITPTGVLTTLHDFTASEAGGGGAAAPPVEGTNGTFYGVMDNGKTYSITPSGTFKLLPNRTYSPAAPLILARDGNFYGTSQFGGSSNYGTVFRMSSSGAIKIIYNFDFTHGASPSAPVVQGRDGYLYGTTDGGGSGVNPAGVVFRLSTTGAITVVHEFDDTSTTDGYEPLGGLAAATDGNFYGTTSVGESGGSARYGTLFKITKTGTYTMLHAFDYTTAHTPNKLPYSTPMA